ncbi:peroxisomal biogenesis factor 19 isoform X1 [Cervus elaphus]|uniref:peroxisomal biogenesis factor 19 isoform X1 n=1 Tax=Cervus elaphus TaxID=9860 RepID=UPI001CC28108|nr:peroxisomal biogenesis factor 19 isoform X1 [Cervus elaphus]
MAARHGPTIPLVARGERAGSGAGRAEPRSPASYGKPEVARWPRLRGTVVSGPKLTGNWKSFWKRELRSSFWVPERATLLISLPEGKLAQRTFHDPFPNSPYFSALDDFDKAKPSPAPPPTTTAPDASGPQKRSPGDTAKDALFASQEKFFQELFDSELASQATAEFEKAMKELAEEEPHLVEQFQKLSEAAGRVGSDATSQQEFTSCLKETLSGLAKNATDLQNSGMSEEELTKAMEGLGMDEGDGEGTILPIMQSIMQNLLSKDVLYPSLKEITEKYPEWLQAHRDSLPPEQFEKYQEQHSVMGKICEQFEAETPTDSEATQKARFEVVLDLMQQLQDLGHPPKELAGEMPPGLNFDLDALNLSGPPGANGEQCLIM